MNGTRRPLDLWIGTMSDWDGITEVMAQNGCLELVNMDELDQVGNEEGLDQVIQTLTPEILENTGEEDLTRVLMDILISVTL